MSFENDLGNLKTSPDLVGECDQKIGACVQGKNSQQCSRHARPGHCFQDQRALQFRLPQGVGRMRRVESAFPVRAG